MIKITFIKKNNKIISFEISGHSNLSEYGTDIVCSAVSSTSLMTLNALLEVLKLDVKYKIDDAYTLCDIGDICNESADAMLLSFFLFIEELAQQYPKNLKFKVMEV